MTQHSPEPRDPQDSSPADTAPEPGAGAQGSQPEWPAPTAWPAPEPWKPGPQPGQGYGGPSIRAGWPPGGLGPRQVTYPAPVRLEPVSGEDFGLAILPAPGAVSGVAIGSLVAAIGSILVSGAVWCFGLMGTGAGWGALVGGAFVVLSGLLGVAGVVLGILSLRQVKRAVGVSMTGRGYGISGIACGGAGIVLAVSGLATAIALS